LPDESALELESRRRIYHYVEDNPGTHMRQVGRELDIPMGTLEYHLRYLVDEGLLATREDDRYTRYFVKGQTSRHEKDVLAAIRQETPRRIVAQLLMEPGASHGEILEEFDVSASTLSFHLNKLVEAGVVEKEKSGRKNLYSIVDEEVASRVLIQYRESFVDDVVDRFAEVWMDLDAGLEGAAAPREGDLEAAEVSGEEAGSSEPANPSEAEDEAEKGDGAPGKSDGDADETGG
jgi:DNA-binding transcriptional ArsR family regulator